MRNQRRDGCERRRIEVARDTLEGGALAHQRLLLTLSAGRRDGAPPDAAVPFRLVEKLAVRGRLPAADLAGEASDDSGSEAAERNPGTTMAANACVLCASPDQTRPHQGKT